MEMRAVAGCSRRSANVPPPSALRDARIPVDVFCADSTNSSIRVSVSASFASTGLECAAGPSGNGEDLLGSLAGLTLRTLL